MDDKNTTRSHQIAAMNQDDLDARDDSGQNSSQCSPPISLEPPKFETAAGLPFRRYCIILDNTFGLVDSYRLKEEEINHSELTRGKQGDDAKWVFFFSDRFAEKFYRMLYAILFNLS